MKIKNFSQKKGIALFIMLGMLIVLMQPFGLPAAPVNAAGPSGAMPLGISLQPSNPEKTVYYAGETANFWIHIGHSSITINDTLYNTVITLDYSAKDILAGGVADPNARPVLVGRPKILGVEPVVDPVACTAVWTIPVFVSGQNLYVSVGVKMPNLYTPDGYKLNVSVDMTEMGRYFQDHDELIFPWTSDQYSLRKYVKAEHYLNKIDDDTFEVYGGSILTGTDLIDPAATSPVTFSFDFKMPSSGAYRDFNKVRTIDYLPDEATFDPADQVGATWIWTYYADYEGSGKKAVVCDTTDLTKIPTFLTLRFPNADTTIEHVNTVEREVFLTSPQSYEDPSYILSDDCAVYLSGFASSGNSLIFDKTGVVPLYSDVTTPRIFKEVLRTGEPFNVSGDYWWLSMTRNTTESSANVEICDDQLDPDMRFTKVLIGSGVVSNPNTISPVVIEYRDAITQEWITLETLTTAPNTNPLLSVGFDDSFFVQYADSSHLDILYPSGGLNWSYVITLPADVAIDAVRASSTINRNRSFVLATCSVLRDDALANFDNTKTNVYENSSILKMNGQSVRSSARHHVLPYVPQMVAEHGAASSLLGTNTYGTKGIGDTFTVHTILSTQDYFAPVEELKEWRTESELEQEIEYCINHGILPDRVLASGAQYITLLPSGLEYVPGSVIAQNGYDLDILASEEPDIIPNYRGTGQTALVWTIRTDTEVYLESWMDQVRLFDFSFDVRVGTTCASGDYSIELYYTWPEYERIAAKRKTGTTARVFDVYADLLDLNDDGQQAENYLYDVNTVSVDFPVGMGGSKGVQGCLDSTMIFTGSGSGLAGSAADWQIRLELDSWSGPVLGYTFIDILPFVGDTGIVANSTSRGSQFGVTLTGPITFDPTSALGREHFNVFYTLKADPDTWGNINTTKYNTDSSMWIPEILMKAEDWAKVTAFKLEMNALGNARMLLGGETIVINMNTLLSENAQPGQIAYNSFAYSRYSSGNLPRPFLDVLKIGIKVPAGSPTDASAVIRGSKVLTGAILKDSQFNFVIKDESNTVVATGVSRPNGAITFTPIQYTAGDIGLHTYTVTEVAGASGKITYDNASYEVTVNVFDDNGVLKAEVGYPDGDIVFRNDYDVTPTSITLTGVKYLEGRPLVANEFEFVVKEEGGRTVATGKNNASGAIIFPALNFTQEGVYKYIISEKRGGSSAITYDDTYYTIIVLVTDNGGVLSAEIIEMSVTRNGRTQYLTSFDATGGFEFKNTDDGSTPDPTTLPLSGTKTSNLPIAADDFRFTLTPDLNNPTGGSSWSGSNPVSVAAGGGINLGTLTFTKAGIYIYTIEEVIPSPVPTGWRYDNHPVTVTVQVTDNAGQLAVTSTTYEKAGQSDTGIKFNNTFTRAPFGGLFTLKGTKILTGLSGEPLPVYAGEFTFTLTPGSGNPADGCIWDGRNPVGVLQGGAIDFGTLTFSKAGTYVFTIHETAPNSLPAGWYYDINDVTVTLVVEKVDDQLVVTSETYEKAGVETDGIEFVNTCGEILGTDSTLIITKEDSKGVPLSGMKFYLMVSDDGGQTWGYYADTHDQPYPTTNEFGKLVIRGLMAGMYKIVEITENPAYGEPIYTPSDTFVILEGETRVVEITVVNPILPPPTGDSGSLTGWLVLSVLALMGCGAWTVTGLKRRKKENN